MSNKKLMTLMAMAATSLYAPYTDEFFQTKEGHKEITVKPLTAGQQQLFREPKRELKEFSIKGHKVMAYSKKDAIKRLKHQKNYGKKTI